ncbi:hypothetical protein [Sporichthya sp.]|uniref:hypothetical protein n=1 Tax=Sporichthya sp. TaxID=65475 RepID=UPI0017EE910A|nr:hypothetical protein [Sporichthya sp.]MBA3744918.1 hypothetical protein [Sporichthya sp.]
MLLKTVSRPLTQLGAALPLPRRLTRTATRPLPLRLVALAIGAAAILIARARLRPSSPSMAAAAWSDVPSAPEWYVPNDVPIKRYDELRAADIVKSVRRLERRTEVQQVLDYEQEHSQRVTVFKAAQARLRALETASR